MAVIEETGIMTKMDSEGNKTLLYPVTKIENVEGFEQADWNETDSSQPSFIQNKPTIPTSLPANGGDADTVDGKHASDFATSGQYENLVQQIESLMGIIPSKTETWTFTLEDGSTVSKVVYVG